jgi:hypothetical protein
MHDKGLHGLNVAQRRMVSGHLQEHKKTCKRAALCPQYERKEGEQRVSYWFCRGCKWRIFTPPPDFMSLR